LRVPSLTKNEKVVSPGEQKVGSPEQMGPPEQEGRISLPIQNVGSGKICIQFMGRDEGEAVEHENEKRVRTRGR
jgi:hypothetical protein